MRPRGGLDRSLLRTLTAGLLLGLSRREMADALAIAVTANVATRQTRAGELSMWKGCATAAAAKAGLKAGDVIKWECDIDNTSANTAAPPEACFSWNDIAFQAMSISAGSTSRATCSIAAIAWPEL